MHICITHAGYSLLPMAKVDEQHINFFKKIIYIVNNVLFQIAFLCLPTKDFGTRVSSLYLDVLVSHKTLL